MHQFISRAESGLWRNPENGTQSLIPSWFRENYPSCLSFKSRATEANKPRPIPARCRFDPARNGRSRHPVKREILPISPSENPPTGGLAECRSLLHGVRESMNKNRIMDLRGSGFRTNSSDENDTASIPKRSWSSGHRVGTSDRWETRNNPTTNSENTSNSSLVRAFNRLPSSRRCDPA